MSPNPSDTIPYSESTGIDIVVNFNEMLFAGGTGGSGIGSLLLEQLTNTDITVVKKNNIVIFLMALFCANNIFFIISSFFC
jgi:hypothetical protein